MTTALIGVLLAFSWPMAVSTSTVLRGYPTRKTKPPSPPRSARMAFVTPAKSGIAERILLREHCDLLRFQPPHFHQIANHRVGFLGVARTIVEHITVRRIVPQNACSRERTVKQGAPLQSKGSRHDSRRRSDISDETEHLSPGHRAVSWCRRCGQAHSRRRR